MIKIKHGWTFMDTAEVELLDSGKVRLKPREIDPLYLVKMVEDLAEAEHRRWGEIISDISQNHNIPLSWIELANTPWGRLSEKWKDAFRDEARKRILPILRAYGCVPYYD